MTFNIEKRDLFLRISKKTKTFINHQQFLKTVMR